MASNKLKIQPFRANDLSEDTGKQFELGKSWCDFFEINDTVGEITFELIFKPLIKEHVSFEGQQIDLQLSAPTNRNDRKAYANGTRSGHSAIKEFFLVDLHLTAENNSNDYFAIYKVSEFEFYLYYIPELLHDNFLELFETNIPVVTRSPFAKRVLEDGQRLQQIFYGAPGTGKSNTIKREVEDAGKKHHRTTFHPDSDYSTFVGTYKPAMDGQHEVRLNLSFDDLASKLSEYYNDPDSGKIEGIQKFCLEYYKYIAGEYMSVSIPKLVEKSGIGDNYDKEITKYINFCKHLPKLENKIIYTFTPQAFTKAYVDAWQTEEEVYLIIEEINRGNCAQIFGDLFQLLDRKNGISEYPIDADTDLEVYLREALKNSPRTDFPEGVKEGKKLVLPSNLYIWATMNTSDQSLFPIDSAFKRRWEWKYIPIKNHPDENYKIEIGKSKYDWWHFLTKINEEIGSTTSSEDKKLGYFFVKAEDGIVKDEQFVGKVLFYLWNDVFKNYGFDNSIFKKEGEKKLEFSDFFNGDGSPNHKSINIFMKNLNVHDENEKKEDDNKEGKAETGSEQ